MGNKNSVADFPESEDILTIVDILLHLPNELANLKMLQNLSEEVLQERQRIIKKLRDMADYLEKTHANVLIADRVGTGVGIGSGLSLIGCLAAAPFTAGISLGIMTIAGITFGILSGITSAGANITDYVLSKKELTSLKKELGEHLLHLEKLSSSDSKYLVRTTRLRPTLEILAKLSVQRWKLLLTTFQKLITHALNGDNTKINQVVDHVADPEIKSLIDKLRLPFNAESLHDLAEKCSLIMRQICKIKKAITAFLNYFKRPELAKLAMNYSGLKAAGKMATSTTIEIMSAFKGTTMAMSKAARTAAGAISATAIFIVVDVIHMVQICKETGETPTVQELRKMADGLEKEIKFDSNETGEIQKEENTILHC
uniref:Apolipoprotein L3 n=1 Tax=Daphnia galeata TaxID=27404 RepID=A0A8J2WIT8_9CRUS|nr:unnamed protein product [Daphnia galeata]